MVWQGLPARGTAETDSGAARRADAVSSARAAGRRRAEPCRIAFTRTTRTAVVLLLSSSSSELLKPSLLLSSSLLFSLAAP